MKVDSSGVDTKKRRRDSRTGWEAELQVSKMKDGKWVVDKFSDIHNNDLTTTPTKVMKHRSFLNLNFDFAEFDLADRLLFDRFCKSIDV